jgi:site-specific recombinase XerD
MAYDYKALERREKEIQKENEKHLVGFEKWLREKGLSQKTINTHVSNVDFYINNYLCYYPDMYDAKQGIRHINGFLGDWFIRKAMWSSCAHIKTNAAGIKKFYAYLLEENLVEQEDYDDLYWTIKEDMQDWLSAMKRYDNMIFDDYY